MHSIDSLSVDIDELKVKAICQHFKISDTEEIKEICNNQYEIDSEPGEYLVLTNEEADQEWEESLDNYIDECILGCIPKSNDVAQTLAQYFDRDAWKADAKHDGRGHSLSSYDGDEIEVYLKDEKTWIYIYRIN